MKFLEFRILWTQKKKNKNKIMSNIKGVLRRIFEFGIIFVGKCSNFFMDKIENKFRDKIYSDFLKFQ